MFRSSLRRLAGPSSAVRTTAVLSQTRLPLRQINTRISLATLQTRIASRESNSGFRFYSTESVATPEDVVANPEDVDSSTTSNEPVDSFKDLHTLGVHRTLTDAIVKGMGFDVMTPVQAKTINPALKGTDIVAQAKTGTGKTLAFLLPLINRMIQEDPSLATRKAAYSASANDIRGIVLSPTRELAEQIATEARRLVKNTGLVVQVAVGGTSKSQMLRQTQRQGCHLLIGTPGRLNDLLQDSSSGIDAPNLAAFVLDEADRMLDVGFERELNEIIDQLPKPDEKQRQTMLVSATIPDNVIRLARSMVRADDFQFVQTIAENESLTHDKVPQKVVQISSWTNLFPTMFELIDREAQKAASDPDARPFKAIIYLNTTALVELTGEIAYAMKREDPSKPPAFTISSRLTQQQRSRAADMFRRSRSGILISSDVTARGMDFPDVTHVIQVDTPRSREDYIHRLGRTGRQGKEGEGWLLLPPGGVGSSRKMLAGLPIKPDSSLASAEAQVTADDLPPSHAQMKEHFQAVPKSMLSSAYTSLFGIHPRKDELAQELYHWSTVGWGWAAPPGVSSRWASQMGIDKANLNVNERFERSDGDRWGGDRGGDRGGERSGNRGGFRGGSGRRNSAPSADPFDRMSQGARRDDTRGYRQRSSW